MFKITIWETWETVNDGILYAERETLESAKGAIAHYELNDWNEGLDYHYAINGKEYSAVRGEKENW